jgi:hypothetical protein
MSSYELTVVELSLELTFVEMSSHELTVVELSRVSIFVEMSSHELTRPSSFCRLAIHGDCCATCPCCDISKQWFTKRRQPW